MISCILSLVMFIGVIPINNSYAENENLIKNPSFKVHKASDGYYKMDGWTTGYWGSNNIKGGWYNVHSHTRQLLPLAMLGRNSLSL
ncbi:hypothetical protein [Peptostreptococcus faecalis]|uniref:hypothetical protein n=1 Tax=Peptostreptococcus faecalis TaxID=2045015 RepID=UPI0011AF356A|nr:hypothetical protein [Peptostreptococcus faecalis]